MLQDEKYKYLFSVEEVNKLVLNGVPFRDAYKKVGANIGAGNFTHSTSLTHTHEGSMGNLCNDQIQARMQSITQKFDFNKAKIALQHLLS